MKKAIAALGFLSVLWAWLSIFPTVAQIPQFPQNLPPNTVVGRTGIVAGPAQAIPFSQFTSGLLTAISGDLTCTINPNNCAVNAGAITNAKLANAPASTIKCNQTTSSAAPQDCVPVSADKTIYVSTGGNDSNSGLNPLFPKLTIQAGVNAALTAGDVVVGAGVYTLTSTLAMRPGVRVWCNDGAIITQGNAQNLVKIVDFGVNTASSGSIERCTVDGNRAGNTDNLNAFCIFGGTANDVTIRGNTIQNCSGYGIDFGAGLRPKIIDNSISNFYVIGVSHITGSPQAGTWTRVEGNHFNPPMGEHAISIVNADYAQVLNNFIFAGNSVNATVNTSGTTITFVSGTNFANVSPGQFAVLNSGQEFLITAKVSNTQLTTSTTLPTLSGTAAVFGTGDMLQIDSSSYARVMGNVLVGGVTQGIGISTTTGGETAQKNVVEGNVVNISGEFCIGVQSISGNVLDNSIVGNNLADCGASVNGIGGGSFLLAGIGLVGGSVLNTWIDGNYVRDDNGSPTVSYWLSLNTAVAGVAILGHNSSRGTLNNGILGDVSSITLTGWGTGAATSAITSYGNAIIFTITSGTGPSAQAQFTINKLTSIDTPIVECKQAGGGNLPQIVYGESTGSNTVWVGIFDGTPAAGAFVFICK